MDQYKQNCEKLVNAKYETIYNFKKCNEKILQVHNLSDYMFYRECFKYDSDVIPFQFIASDSKFKITKYNNDIIKKYNQCVVFFNIYDNHNIFSWNTVISDNKIDDALSSNENDMSSIYHTLESSKLDNDDFDSHNEKHIEIVDRIETWQQMKAIRTDIKKDLIKKSEITKIRNQLNCDNEFDLLISNMMYLFWNIAVDYDESDHSIKYDFPTESSKVQDMIKNDTNIFLRKMSEIEREKFAMTKLPAHENINEIESIFTVDVINNIIDSCQTSVIEHTMYGYYKRDDHGHERDEINIYFGFYRK
jgi:hypothetical protein